VYTAPPALSQYVFQRSTSLGGPYTTIATQASGTYVDSGLASSTYYYYRAAAIVSDGRQTVWSTIRSQNTASGDPTSTRRFAPGHYVTLARSQSYSGATPDTGQGTYTGIAPTTISDSGPVTSDTAGVVMRQRWGDLEKTGTAGVYDFSNVSADLARMATISANAGKTVLYFLLIEQRTFTGTTYGDNPMPPYLISTADGGTGTTTYATTFTSGASSGWQGWRWHPTVLPRFQALCNALGAAFDSNPYWGGIGTQETSNGGITTQGGYTPDVYQAALKTESDYVTNAMTNGRHLWYFNFMSGTTNADATSRLLDVAAHIRSNGAIVGGPDLVTSGSITTRCYPNYTKYHNGTTTFYDGSPGPALTGPTFCCVQQSEWTANGSPAGQAYMTDLYNYGTSSFTYKAVDNGTDHTGGPLNLDIIIWNWQTSAATGNFNQKYNPDSSSIQHAHPTFGTWAP